MYASLLTPFRVMSGNEEFTIKDSNGDDFMIPCEISVPVLTGGTLRLPNGDTLWINEYMGEFVSGNETWEGITIALGSGHEFGLMLLKYNPSTHVFYSIQESIYGLYEADDMYNRGNELKIYDFDGISDYNSIQKWTDEPDWIAHGAVYLGSLILQRKANAPAGTAIDQYDYWTYRYSMGQTVTLNSQYGEHDGQQLYISPMSAVQSEIGYYFEYDTGEYLPLMFVLEAENSQGNLQFVSETNFDWLSCMNTDITRDWKITIIGFRSDRAESYEDFQQVDWENFDLLDVLHEDIDVSGYLLADGAEPAHSYGWTYTDPNAS